MRFLKRKGSGSRYIKHTMLIQWLHGCFEPTTQEKADGKMHLLICDEHDSHITGVWIDHCMRNDIVLMILIPLI